MARRRAARELLLKVLFQIDVGRLPPEEVLSLAFEEVPATDAQRRYVEETTHSILAHLPEIDPIIAELLEGWTIGRLANVDRTLLRMALYELWSEPEPQTALIIEEAVELAKKYSTAESGKFVNGVLGAYARRQKAAAGAAQE